MDDYHQGGRARSWVPGAWADSTGGAGSGGSREGFPGEMSSEKREWGRSSGWEATRERDEQPVGKDSLMRC